MGRDRLTAFSDGVIAVIITIMVLELKVPHGADWNALRGLAPIFLSYVLSFVYVAIYWNNHHHFLHTVTRVSGPILWANNHLLFWISLIPFSAGWMSENDFAPLPTAVYGVSLLMPGLAWLLLQNAITRKHGREAVLAKALGRDLKGKMSSVGLLCRGDHAGFRQPLDLAGDLCSGRPDLAHARPAYRARHRRRAVIVFR